MLENGATESQRLVETDCAYEEWERLGQQDGIDRNANEHGERQGQNEAQRAACQDGGRQPEVASQSTRREEQAEEGGVHQEVTCGNESNIQRRGTEEKRPQAVEEC